MSDLVQDISRGLYANSRTATAAVVLSRPGLSRTPPPPNSIRLYPSPYLLPVMVRIRHGKKLLISIKLFSTLPANSFCPPILEAMSSACSALMLPVVSWMHALVLLSRQAQDPGMRYSEHPKVTSKWSINNKMDSLAARSRTLCQ